jgi:hypothetical protein
VFGDLLPSRYAHQLFVQSAEHEVVLAFFEVIPPILMGTVEEQQAALSKGVKAECVARIAVSRERYPDFVRVMGDILKMLPKDNEKPSATSK